MIIELRTGELSRGQEEYPVDFVIVASRVVARPIVHPKLVCEWRHVLANPDALVACLILLVWFPAARLYFALRLSHSQVTPCNTMQCTCGRRLGVCTCIYIYMNACLFDSIHGIHFTVQCMHVLAVHTRTCTLVGQEHQGLAAFGGLAQVPRVWSHPTHHTLTVLHLHGGRAAAFLS